MDSKIEVIINAVFDRARQFEAELIDTRIFWFLLGWAIAAYVYN